MKTSNSLHRTWRPKTLSGLFLPRVWLKSTSWIFIVRGRSVFRVLIVMKKSSQKISPKKIPPKKFPQKNSSQKNSSQKIHPNNFSQKIHTKKSSQKIPRNFFKKSNENPKIFLILNIFWKYPIPYIALRGRKPFRACFI